MQNTSLPWYYTKVYTGITRAQMAGTAWNWYRNDQKELNHEI